MILTGAVILNVSWMMEGCTGKIAPITAIVPTAAPTLGTNVVSNFEDGSSNLNPNLFQKPVTPGPVTFLPGNLNPTAPAPLIGVFSVLPAGNFISTGGSNGTNRAGHLTTGPVPTPMSGYSPFDITAVPNPTGSYDLSPSSGATFTGIRFDWKIGASDNMGGRWFISPIAAQLPPPLGDCPGTGGGCYDTYKINMSMKNVFPFGPYLPDTWYPVSITWASLTQAGWGTPSVGPLSGTYLGVPNLSRIEYFQWEEDPNNISSLYTVDFWVDEIALY